MGRPWPPKLQVARGTPSAPATVGPLISLIGPKLGESLSYQPFGTPPCLPGPRRSRAEPRQAPQDPPLAAKLQIVSAEEVLAANRRFYEAFEARDMDLMSDLWERSERVSCTHPGWASLEGWGAVAASFFALFQSGPPIQFLITRERAEVRGDVGWVSCDENLLGDQGGVTVSSLNIFCRRGETGSWRMVCHHGSVVHSQVEHPA